MAKKAYEETHIAAIAEKIRERTKDRYGGSGTTYKTKEMVSGVEQVHNFQKEKLKKLIEGSTKWMEIPEGTTALKRYAFAGCDKLAEVRIPKSVKTLNYRAFENCGELYRIYFNAEDADDLTSSGDVFYGCGHDTTGIILTIGKDVKRIPSYLFKSYSTPKIGWVKFEEGSNCHSIGAGAFADANNLNIVYITDVAKWCEMAFADYRSNPLYYAKWLYLNNEALTELTIPQEVSLVNDYTFYNCICLAKVTMHSGIGYIGTSAFKGCSNLKDIYVSWGEGAVPGAPWGATKATIHYQYIGTEGLQYTLNGTEYICSGYTGTASKVTIPDEFAGLPVTYIGQNAFLRNQTINQIILGPNIKQIGIDSFNSCKNLTTSIHIPSSVENIQVRAFRDSGISGVTFAKDSKLKLLQLNCFRDTDIRSITIPASVEQVVNKTFESCDLLTMVRFEGTPIKISADVFTGCNALTDIYVPWTEGQVANAPWGATNATIHYNS